MCACIVFTCCSAVCFTYKFSIMMEMGPSSFFFFPFFLGGGVKKFNIFFVFVGVRFVQIFYLQDERKCYGDLNSVL